MLLCRSLSGGDASAPTPILIGAFALCIYEGGAIYGGIKRTQNNMPAIDTNVTVSILVSLFCFIFPFGGIVATLLLNRSESDHSRPAFVGTLASFAVWLFLFIGAMASL
jgi:hypothetical protein